MSRYDIIIVGAGIVGATCALALAKKTSLQIAVLDAKELSSQWQPNQTEQRVSAISLASQRIFQQLKIWDAMRELRVNPYKKMSVWDANGSGRIDFDAEKLQSNALGFIIEDEVMRRVLLNALRAEKNIHLLAPVELISLLEEPDLNELTTQQHGALQAKLIIAADGANSWLRDAATIFLKTRSYDHHALVATVTTELPHNETARQKFLAGGPLAFLPLSKTNLNSIVWSAAPEQIAELLSLDDEEFKLQLRAAFGSELGNMENVSQRLSFPLHMRHAQQYVKYGIALIGDAAHTLHPLAGQGVNLGLLDAVSIVDVIAEALKKNRDFASYSTLRRYERWRKGDNTAMLVFVEAIKMLFASETKPVKHLRNAGLNLTNQLTFVKNFFVSYAAGNRSDLPELARAMQ
jgi:2-polyprenylphenol 6-hydroxylase